MPAPRPVELLQEAVSLLRQLADQGRAWSAEDLLTHGEALRRLRAGKDNRDARVLLDRTERKHAPGDARWRWGASSLRQVLRRACRRASVPTYTPYALRRAFAGKLRRAGMDVTERAAVMGHSPAVHLASYDRAQPEDLRAGMKGAKLEELPEGAVLPFKRRQA